MCVSHRSWIHFGPIRIVGQPLRFQAAVYLSASCPTVSNIHAAQLWVALTPHLADAGKVERRPLTDPGIGMLFVLSRSIRRQLQSNAAGSRR